MKIHLIYINLQAFEDRKNTTPGVFNDYRVNNIIYKLSPKMYFLVN